MRKSRILLVIVALMAPLLFLGCEGDDGAPGAQGGAGAPGAPGPGALANETCSLCHAAGHIADTAAEHAEERATGTVTAVITDAEITADTASVTFDFSATDADGNPVVVDLTAPGTGNLTYLRFTIARLVPGAGPGDPDQWDFYDPRSHRAAANLAFNGGVSYTFTFDNTVRLDPADSGLTHRVGFELNITNFPAEARLRSVNPTFDWVPAGGDPTTREIVTTAACNQCHDPLIFHGGRRVDTDYCVMCHNTNDPLAPQSAEAGAELVPIPFFKLIHGIHTGQDLQIYEPPDPTNEGDFTEVTYPQDVRNCTKCHQGGADSGNWNTRPSIEACGACHGVDIFAPGGGHGGGPQSNNDGCAASFCHGSSLLQPSVVHRTENVTPNNPGLPGTLSYFEYGIESVTVDNTNAATIKFFIKQDGALANLGDNVITAPTGFTGGPSFLFAYTMEQDEIATPVDYNNLGRTAGQPRSVSLVNPALPIAASDNASYTVTVANAFPAGAKMRAVALQGYFTQTSGGIGLDNVGRHTPSVQKAVTATGEAVRRTIVKSGYVDNNTGLPVTDPAAFATARPVGCLECHEIFEGHGGSRVNNVQVCVMCHNPNLSSSGRTANPSLPSDVENEDQDPFLVLGPDPLAWPEATNDFKELIHGIHAATDRPYEFVRNRLNGIYYNFSEVTFPGDLANCEKCHLPGTYNLVPANALWPTERITTGDPAETRDDVLAARASMPNGTDLVNSPTASACFYCHDGGTAVSHILLQGGKLSYKDAPSPITRDEALQLP